MEEMENYLIMENKQEISLRRNEFQGERILLRPFKVEDLEDLFEFTSDEEATRFIYPAHRDIEQTEKLLTNYYLKEPIGKYAMELKESNKMIGTVEFRVHAHNQNGELGYTLLRDYWGKGYMTEATTLILNHAFHDLKLARVFAEYDIRNDASGKLLTRIGMQRDGVLRKNQMVNGVLTDSVHCSILREEFVV